MLDASFSVLPPEVQDLFRDSIDVDRPQDFFAPLLTFVSKRTRETNKQLGAWIDHIKKESKGHRAVKDFIRKGKTKEVLLSIISDFLIKGLLAIHLDKISQLNQLQTLYKYLVDFSDREKLGSSGRSKPAQIDEPDALRKQIVEEFRVIAKGKLQGAIQEGGSGALDHEEKSEEERRPKKRKKGSTAAEDATHASMSTQVAASAGSSLANGEGGSGAVHRRLVEEKILQLENENKLLKDFVKAMKEFIQENDHSAIYAPCFEQLGQKLPHITQK